MKRRNFIRNSSMMAFAGALPASAIAADMPTSEHGLPPIDDRQYWVSLMTRMAMPVLTNMAAGTLKKNMPIEVSPSWDGRDKAVSYMEAFGRLIAGITPWLSLPDDTTKEGKTRAHLRQLVLQGLSRAADPNDPDYLLWNKEGQPLVDAAFLAHGLLRAPATFWIPLSTQTKQNIIREFKALRRVKPGQSNWLLFGAIIEAFLLSIDEQYEASRIDDAVTKINSWYVGDGWYGDGPVFHFDYYNGFVIQPMLVDVLAVMVEKGKADKKVYDTAVKRMQRHGVCQERLISPEGTFPAFGRSITYRVGAFQPLAQLALMKQLPALISGAQVRSALTAVMKKIFEQRGVFSADGWLQLGFAGHQPGVSDSYTNTGSLYLTAVGFLALGLPANDEFWTAPAAAWTNKKAWGGEEFGKDKAIGG
jgi:hypothetical protein